MVGLLWGLAIGCTLVGALFYWGARTLAVESFYLDAALILFLALMCAALAHGLAPEGSLLTPRRMLTDCFSPPPLFMGIR